MGQQPGVGGDDDDDRARLPAPHRPLGDLLPNRDTRDPELPPHPVVGLHEHADGVAALPLVQSPRGGPDASLELVTDHYRPFQHARLLDPGRAGHLAVAVEREPACEDRVARSFTPGQDGADLVRTGPLPTASFPWPEIRVVCPTSTPFTSVIALSGPGVPSQGTPRSRARGFNWAETVAVLLWRGGTFRRRSRGGGGPWFRSSRGEALSVAVR